MKTFREYISEAETDKKMNRKIDRKHAEAKEDKKKGSVSKIEMEPKMNTSFPGAINSWPGVTR